LAADHLDGCGEIALFSAERGPLALRDAGLSRDESRDHARAQEQECFGDRMKPAGHDSPVTVRVSRGFLTIGLTRAAMPEITSSFEEMPRAVEALGGGFFGAVMVPGLKPWPT